MKLIPILNKLSMIYGSARDSIIFLLLEKEREWKTLIERREEREAIRDNLVEDGEDSEEVMKRRPVRETNDPGLFLLLVW